MRSGIMQQLRDCGLARRLPAHANQGRQTIPSRRGDGREDRPSLRRRMAGGEDENACDPQEVLVPQEELLPRVQQTLSS